MVEVPPAFTVVGVAVRLVITGLWLEVSVTETVTLRVAVPPLPSLTVTEMV
jgi:hypothetical protein